VGSVTPQDEIDRRYGLIREAMARDGLDAVIVSGNEYSGFEGAVTYMSGFVIVHRYAYVLLPLEGDPSIVFPREATYVGEHGTTWIDDQVFVDKPGDWLADKVRGQRVGVYGLDYVMTVRDYRALDGVAEIVPWDIPFDHARAVKSERELESVRDSVRINTEGFWTLLNMSFSIAVFYIRKAIDEKNLLEAVQKDSNFFKLRYLRAQLNPHFLFNTLNSIYSLSLQKSEKTPEVVVKLADIMRYLIYECNEERIALDKEIEFIRSYIDIEKIRYKADIRFTVEAITSGVLIEPYLFISFIENGFKHALDNSFAEPFIYITLKVEQEQIVLNVINSTNADLETQATKRMNGKGLANSRSLLELLYPDAYELDIIQTEKEENRNSQLRLHNARERLETLYPDAFTLDVILSKSAFTVSLIIRRGFAPSTEGQTTNSRREELHFK